jgi:predicted transcriptional regulator
MKLKEIVEILKGEVLTGKEHLEKEAKGGFAGDMLSFVLANAKEGDVWLTIQTHINIIPVAVMKGIPAIIFVSSKTCDEDVLNKAKEENIVLIKTPFSLFESCGIIYNKLK